MSVRLLLKSAQVGCAGTNTRQRHNSKSGTANKIVNPLLSSTMPVSVSGSRSRFGTSGFDSHNNSSFTSNGGGSMSRKGEFSNPVLSDDIMSTQQQCYNILNERGNTGESPLEKLSARRGSMHSSRRSLVLNASGHASGFTAGVVERNGRPKNVPSLEFMPSILLNNSNNQELA